MSLYIIVAVWPNTRDNHAGMYYLAKEFRNKCNYNVKIFTMPTWKAKYLYPIYQLYSILLAIYIRVVAKKEDTVWLMEYLLKATDQFRIAKILQGKVNIIAIAHLVPSLIEKRFSNKSIFKRIEPINRLYVLGSSLETFFLSKNVPKEKLCTTFHYVDTTYYFPLDEKQNINLKIICMGNMQRDYAQLQQIISNVKEASFIICQGTSDLREYFDKFNNVELIGFISEDELRDLMRSSDVSLNIMKDTIGSNVITTSLACGLPVLASNVGSIKDYITDGINGKLFNTTEQAIFYLKELMYKPDLVKYMRIQALKRAQDLDINNFIQFISNEINN